jgi:hypothetical protein
MREIAMHCWHLLAGIKRAPIDLAPVFVENGVRARLRQLDTHLAGNDDARQRTIDGLEPPKKNNNKQSDR